MAFQKKAKKDPRIKPKTRAKRAKVQHSTGEPFHVWVEKEFTDTPVTPLAPRGGAKDFLPPEAKQAAEASQSLPLLAFEPQLARINRILHYWLNTVDSCAVPDGERDHSLPVKIDMITKLSKSLHDNLRLTTDAIRLLHEIHDVRTLNRIVLDAIGEVAPELRIQVVRRLQQAHGMIKVLPPGLPPVSEPHA